jgi:protein arginine kinase
MAFSAIDPQRFASKLGEWIAHPGPEADVAVSCRARLARNVEGFPFVLRLDAVQAEELARRVRDVLVNRRIDGETIWVTMAEAPPLVRQLLRERHLVSRDLAPSDGKKSAAPGRAVAFGDQETTAVMVNEEDHLRLQGMSAGFQPREAWTRVRDLDVLVERELGYACSERLGYLTGCPTNVGTGLRLSVMLHMPGLALSKSELEKVFTAAQRTGLAVRGMYGEGSRAIGDYYQISNQVTLGRSEEQLIIDLESLVPCIVDFERKVRQVLLEEQRQALEDRVQRSLGMLKSARSLPTDTALQHLSNLRLGAALGLVAGLAPTRLDQVAIQIQRGHVQALAGDAHALEQSEPTERDRMRAAWLRRQFADA